MTVRRAAIRAKYERIARVYDRLDRGFERRRYRPLRPILFKGLTGAVLDAGVGTGCNMPFYAPKAWVVGVDLSRAMLVRAKAKADAFGSGARLAQMDIRRTAFANASFDAAVASFLFCVLAEDDQLPALKELKRIVRPGGEIRLLEYVYSRHPMRRFVQWLWSPWVRLAYGAGFDRQTARHVHEAGLIAVEEKFLFRDMIKLMVARMPGRLAI